MSIHQEQITPSGQPTTDGSLPPTVSVATAATLLRVSRTAAYRAATARVAGEDDRWPTPVIKVGKSLRIPTKALLDALGIDAEEAELTMRDTASDRSTGHVSAA